MMHKSESPGSENLSKGIQAAEGGAQKRSWTLDDVPER